MFKPTYALDIRVEGGWLAFFALYAKRTAMDATRLTVRRVQ